VLKKRVLTALGGVPLLLFFAFLGGYWYGLIVLIIAGLALKEYYSMMRQDEGGWKPLELAGYFFLPLVLWAVYKESPFLLFSLWIFCFASMNLAPVFFFTKVKYWESAISFWGIVYTGGLSSFLLAIRMLPDGFFMTLFFYFLVWSADILAYFVGSFAGKTPLAPLISPKKTVEGTLGGVLGGVISALILVFVFKPSFLNLLTGVLIALIIGLTSALGDLSQSALKRNAGVKDSGSLLPGHGGLLDRFDSMLFSAPFFYVFVRVFLL